MRILCVLFTLLVSFSLFVQSRPSSLLHGRVFDNDNGIAVDSVPKRQAPAAADYAEKIIMLETNKLPSLSKYFSMHEW